MKTELIFLIVPHTVSRLILIFFVKKIAFFSRYYIKFKFLLSNTRQCGKMKLSFR